MSQHTPGPWKAAAWQTTDFHIKSDWPGFADDQQHLVATVPANREGPARTRANAALIASAPELLTACRALLDDIDSEGDVLQFHHSLIDAIRKAVDRAEGSDGPPL